MLASPRVQLSLRYTLTCLLVGEDAPFDRRRHILLTSAIVASSLGVALVFPTAAERIYAFTGEPDPSGLQSVLRTFIGLSLSFHSSSVLDYS